MLNAFLISRRLHTEYKVNGTLNVLRHVSLLRKVLPPDVYSQSWIKSVVQVFKIIGEVFSFFLGKAVYLGIMVLLPCIFLKDKGVEADTAAMAVHILFFMTLLGAHIHNPLFEASEEMFYAVFLLRMDAKKYALSNYIYFLIKSFLGFLVVIGACRAIVKSFALPLYFVILLPLYVVCAKLLASWLNLRFFRRHGSLITYDAPKYGKLVWVFTAVCVLAAYGPVVFGITLPYSVVTALCLAVIAGGAASAVMLYGAKDYRRVLRYIELKNRELVSDRDEAVKAATKESTLKKISADDLDQDAPAKDKGLKGCAFFNELFVRRHRKLLTKTAKLQAAVLALVFAAAAAACLLVPDLAARVNSNILGVLPIFLFVMYMLNRGETVTQAMFFNCDSSMMIYNIYRRPDVILGIFTERLKTLVRINLLPSCVIAAGLPLVYLCSGGTKRPFEYAVMAVTILAISVFFSVHYLTMYYLLQPYTEGLAQKGVGYRVVMGLTYAVCYAGLQVKALRANSLLFGIVVCIFTVLYVAAALVLTYRLAPKTFRLRR